MSAFKLFEKNREKALLLRDCSIISQKLRSLSDKGGKEGVSRFLIFFDKMGKKKYF